MEKFCFTKFINKGILNIPSIFLLSHCSKVMENHRLLKVVIFHAIFSGFGDISANVVNYMSVPFQNFLGHSLQRRYGIEPGSEKFNLIYSGIASSFFVGVFFGGMSMARCMEHFGRKGTAIYVRCILGIISSTAMILAQWIDFVELFVIGHFLTGALMTLKVVLFIYLAECAPINARGLSSTALGSGSSLLLLFVSPLCLPAIFGNDRNWWLFPAICFLLAMTHLFVASHFPESPKHLLIGMGQKELAKMSIQFYHGHSANIEEIFEEFESERLVVHREKVEFHEFWISRRLRFSMGLALMIGFVPSISLLSLKSQYLEPMLMQYGLGQSAAMISMMVLNALGTPLSLLAPFLIERKGRRPLFLAITAFSTLELAAIFLAQCLFDLFGDKGGLAITGIALLGCAFGQASLSLGILHMNSILVGELFPYQARAKATQLSQLVPMLLILAVVISYPSAIPTIGSLFFLPLLVISTILLIFMWKWLPETKGLPVDEIFRNICESNSASPKSSTSSNSIYGSIEKREEEEKCKLIA